MIVAWSILIGASLVGGLVSALHYALRDYSLIKLHDLVDRRGRRGLVERVLKDVDGHVLATGMLRVLCNVAITVSAVIIFRVFHAEPTPLEAFDAVSSAAPAARLAIDWWGLGGACALASACIYFMSMVIPMSLAEHAGERLIDTFAAPLGLLRVLALPVRALSVIDLAVRRLAGVAHVSEAEQLEDQILSAATEGKQQGQLEETQRSMIEAVVGFNSKTVEEIMTPRTEIEGFELTDDLAFIRRFIEAGGHSRIPVYVGDLDHIVGILYAKDLLACIGADTSAFKLRPVLRRPVWVPESKPLTELLYELRARKVHMAIVLDEYGGTTGLVTFEDLMEEIVGEIQDEYEPASDTLPEITLGADQRSAEVDGRAYIKDANTALSPIAIQIPESDEYDTVGGFVITALGHIPSAGESLSTAGMMITVLEAQPTRVTRLRLEPAEPAEPARDGEPSDTVARADELSDEPRARAAQGAAEPA